jgi:hypothetical protein
LELSEEGQMSRKKEDQLAKLSTRMPYKEECASGGAEDGEESGGKRRKYGM